MIPYFHEFQAFSGEEALEIARLLKLERDQERAKKWLDWLSYEVWNSRRMLDLWREMFAEARSQHRHKKRGRPESLGDAGAVQSAAVAYMRCTGKRPTNSRGGAFFRLAQLCTRLNDPGPLIAKLPRPFSGTPHEDSTPLPGTTDEVPESIDDLDWLPGGQ